MFHHNKGISNKGVFIEKNDKEDQNKKGQSLTKAIHRDWILKNVVMDVNKQRQVDLE
jgi:hypothetical protein